MYGLRSLCLRSAHNHLSSREKLFIFRLNSLYKARTYKNEEGKDEVGKENLFRKNRKKTGNY